MNFYLNPSLDFQDGISGPARPLLIDPGVASSLRSHSPLATFGPRLSALPVPAQRALPSSRAGEHYLLAASVGATSTRPASTTFWPRLRRYTLCATRAFLSCATIYPRRAKRLPEPIMVVVCEGDPGCAATPRACPGYLLTAPSALHAVRNASILVVRNHILVLRAVA